MPLLAGMPEICCDVLLTACRAMIRSAIGSKRGAARCACGSLALQFDAAGCGKPQCFPAMRA